jgi:predicted nuclease of predicted toxin-antitoxin system
MRVLLDECVPKKLKREIIGHDVKTVAEMKWAGTKNGALLHLASNEFDVLLTVDQGFSYQQNFINLPISIVIIKTHSNDINYLRGKIPAVLQVLTTIQSRQLVQIDA